MLVLFLILKVDSKCLQNRNNQDLILVNAYDLQKGNESQNIDEVDDSVLVRYFHFICFRDKAQSCQVISLPFVNILDFIIIVTDFSPDVFELFVTLTLTQFFHKHVIIRVELSIYMLLQRTFYLLSLIYLRDRVLGQQYRESINRKIKQNSLLK